MLVLIASTQGRMAQIQIHYAKVIFTQNEINVGIYVYV